MVTWFDYMVETERRRDERMRAEEQRQFDHVLRNERVKSPRPLHRYEIILASLGDRLVEWGCRLQTRYRRVTESGPGFVTDPVVTRQPADPCGCT